MSTKQKNKRVVIVRSSKSKSEPKVRRPRHVVPVGVPLNVKVVGERTMLKRVTLMHFQGSGKNEIVKVMTGQRGRPSLLHVSQIERHRVL